MAVGEETTSEIHSVAGIRLAAVASGIRYENRLDLVLVEIAEESTVAGVFTRNAFCAAPVLLSREHLQQVDSRYFLVNTGNANAGTGEKGMIAALSCCQTVAEMAGVKIQQVLPFSTGVIGEELPVDKIVLGIPDAYTSLADDNWHDAATGILTTDTRPKIVSTRIEIDGKPVTITGFAKGSGMIKPNMATMLAYVFTDMEIGKSDLQDLLTDATNRSFNRITVDGDTSTNDCCMLVATGAGTVALNDVDGNQRSIFVEALNALFVGLAKGLIRDAEGASKFITIEINQGASEQECLKVAYAVAESPLVKTAFFASDPNWGRVLAVIGRAGLEDLDIDAVAIYLGDTCIVSGGGVDAGYSEEKGQTEMDRQEITVRIDLARGQCHETLWTSDLSHDYVRINADYRS